jgi:hypothetical protein
VCFCGSCAVAVAGIVQNGWWQSVAFPPS